MDVERPALNEIPTRVALTGNYPNPFNPATVIQYELPDLADVELSIHDVLGRRVTTLVSGSQAAGLYESPWDATGVASGVYVARLQVGAVVRTTSLMLHYPPYYGQARTLEMLRLFAKEVLPHVQAMDVPRLTAAE